MKICILHPSYEDSVSPTRDYDCDCDPAAWLEGHECENHFLRKATAVGQVEALALGGFDVFINLCDGAADEDRPGIEVVRALERLGLPFTGAASHFYEPTRQQLKAACAAQGVLSPAWTVISDGLDPAVAAGALRFPLIVKHPNSYGSIGLTRASRVESAAQLRAQTERMVRMYGGAMIEEFIEGREFTVLVAENPDDPNDPVAYPPVEFRFPEGEIFKHFEMKWQTFEQMDHPICEEPGLRERICETSKKVFLGLHGNSYARLDLRMDPAGDLFVLDVNPNCGVFYPPKEEGSADLILELHPGGHREFLDLIIRAALRRRRNIEEV